MKLMQLKRHPRRWQSFEATASAEHWADLTDAQVVAVLDSVVALYTDHIVNGVVEPLGPPTWGGPRPYGRVVHHREYLVRYDLAEQPAAPAVPLHIRDAEPFIVEALRGA